MNRETLKRLADLTAREKEVSETVAGFVLHRLSTADLKTFLFYLRRAQEREKVTVRLPVSPDTALRQRLAGAFPGKEVRFETDPSLGGGIQYEHGDNLVNINVKNMLEQVFSRIKESI